MPSAPSAPAVPSATGLLATASVSAAGPPLENGELKRLQQKRERAQKMLEREREQERHDRDRNQENLIPDSKKAPQVRRGVLSVYALLVVFIW